MTAAFLILYFLAGESSAKEDGAGVRSLSDQLTAIREHVVTLEQDLVTGVHLRQDAKKQIFKIRKLLVFQKQEQQLGQKRLAELEHTVSELELRRTTLSEKMTGQRIAIRRFLIAIEASSRGQTSNHIQSLHLPETEKLEAPRRKVLARLVDRGLKEIEILHADLVDASRLEGRIQEEKQQLAYLIQDLKEQEGILELNNQVQLDLLRKKQNEHVSQLENYRKLKSAEGQVENLIHDFNARKELEGAMETERIVSQATNQNDFVKFKGKLPYPVSGGRVVTGFGRAYDSLSGLYIFKKGVEIVTGRAKPVKAVFAGKVAYAGYMPHYGQVVIIDHGEHFYSLCAHLGVISKKASETVAAGTPIGLTGDSGTPLYFEIRARNVAVNPLQWLVN